MRRCRLTFALSLLTCSGPALAVGASEAPAAAQRIVAGVESDLAHGFGTPKLLRSVATPAERIAAGEMLLRVKDYDQAVETLSKVLELHRQGKAPEAAYVDAEYLLAEAYFESRQYLSARRHYRELVNKGARVPYDRYAGRALSRLVDIAQRTDDLKALEPVFERLSELPQSDKTASLQYARAKLLFVRGDYTAAQTALRLVPATSEYLFQSQYLAGVILTKEAQARVHAKSATGSAQAAEYTAAIEQFRKLAQLTPRSPSERQVVDTAWLAVGRLLYESEDYFGAAEAYTRVERASPAFNTMLYELAWVYVRVHDFKRARRALEVLAATDPNNLEQAEGALLRADLMLRSGEYREALALYRSVERHFEPMRSTVDQFLEATTDPAVYYDKLTAEDIPGATSEKLPAIVLEWARDIAREEHVFGIIDDVTRSRELLRRSRKLAAKLSRVLAVSTRVKAFPEIRLALQNDLSALNRLTRARSTLAEGLDDAAPDVGGEVLRLRRERRALLTRLKWLPVSESDFAGRDESGDRQWSGASQALQSLLLEVDRLSAILNGLRRVLKEADQHGVTGDAASRERFRLEIEANERDVAVYHRKLDEIRDALEQGKAQIGFGDQRYLEDARFRHKLREIVGREVALARSGAAGADGAAYARSIQALLEHVEQLENRLDSERARYERLALELANSVARKIAEEERLLEEQLHALDALDEEGRLVVGQIAMKNFGLVRDRLKSIVLRADVGITQEAWEEREQQRIRLLNLQRERAREEQQLNDELREVLDDAEEDR